MNVFLNDEKKIGSTTIVLCNLFFFHASFFAKRMIKLLLFAYLSKWGFSYVWIGCYEDKIEDRDIQDEVFLNDEDMSPKWCEQQCTAYSYPYFSLQFANECFCGNQYGKHGQRNDSECFVPCAGNKHLYCGGSNRNSVFKVNMNNTTETKEEKDVHKNLIGLVMMVKNEAHTLGETLPSLSRFIDYYFILDTGSTDGTPEVIRNVFDGKVRGEMFYEPFVDYGTSRNRILDLAAASPNVTTFTLMLSADETVYNAHRLREFCIKKKEEVQHGAYSIMMDTGERFESARLQRTSAGWRYHGKVHEYLAAPSRDVSSVTPLVPAAYIRFRATDHWRRFESQKQILEILEQEKKIIQRIQEPRSISQVRTVSSTITPLLCKNINAESGWVGGMKKSTKVCTK